MKKKYLKFPLFLAVGAITAFGFSSCSDDDNDTPSTSGTLTQNQQEMKAIAQQYIDHTVNNTYAGLATETGKLYDQLKAAKDKFVANPNSLTQAEIDEICATFIEARSYYEESEAFLFGAATDFGIDPHIDTWPLDADGLAVSLTNKNQLEALSGDADDAIAYAGGKLGQDLLGFHGIEFVIFRDGKNRTVAALQGEETDPAFTKINAHVTGKEELIFATAVAGDLRDRCWQMETAWNADAPQAHFDRMDEVGLPYTINGSSRSYGQNFLNSGSAGSTYASWEEAMVTILQAGCENISNEVANTKIGNPYSGEDVNYIESPYSERSFIDFEDNLISIQNSLYGGRAESRDESKSLISFMKAHNYSGLTKIESDMTAAINALKDCQTLAGGFVHNVNNAKVGVAQKAIQALDEDLTQAAEWFAKQ